MKVIIAGELFEDSIFKSVLMMQYMCQERGKYGAF